MIAPKFTPGPWEVDQWGSVVSMATNRLSGITVARGTGGITKQEREANAKAIAATPELYAACESALKQLRSQSEEPDPRVIKELEAALAKARGEA